MNSNFLDEQIPIIRINPCYSPDESQVFELRSPNLLRVASIESDILSDELKPLLKNKFIKKVFSFLSEYIQKEAFDSLVLSKLIMSEYSEEDAVVEWNYNYFRAYFYFDFINLDDSEVGLIATKGKDSLMQRINLNNENYANVISTLCDFIEKRSFNL